MYTLVLAQSRHNKPTVGTGIINSSHFHCFQLLRKMSGIFTAVKSAFTSKGLDKPKYTPKEKCEGFEERHYEACKWVSTKVMSMTHKDGVSKGFWRLFQYISGENERKEKVEMTAPVATQVLPGAGPNCESTFTVSFYIPPEHQADPPKPKNPDVFISDWPEMNILVKPFSGFASEEDWINKGRQLAEDLDKNNFKDSYIQEYYFTAGYDSPFKLFGRLNEVWFVKNDDITQTQKS